MTLLAGIDPGWAAAIGTLLLAAGGFAGLFLEQRRARRKEEKDEATKNAEAPALELTATSKAAEAIARAAASLIAPFQQTISDMSREHGALREAISTSRQAEEKCQADLQHVRTELHETRVKLREVTEHLGIDPDGLDKV